MASFMRRAMVYLGLQDDDVYYDDGFDDDHGHDALPSRPETPRGHDGRTSDGPGDIRVVRSAPEPYGNEPTVRTIPRDTPTVQPSAVTVSTGGVLRTAGSARVHVVEPHGFNSAQEIGDRLKVNQPVIVNLQGVPRDLQRRLIDFASGLAYGVGGSMSRVADQVFLLTPTNVEVSEEEKERLSARGLYRD
jgi:cell division inhibitor SepF